MIKRLISWARLYPFNNLKDRIFGESTKCFSNPTEWRDSNGNLLAYVLYEPAKLIINRKQGDLVMSNEGNVKSLAATWEVCAGLIPGTPMSEYTRQFHYTSDDKVADMKRLPTEMTIFTAQMFVAHQYAQSLTNPAALNWVDITFIWY